MRCRAFLFAFLLFGAAAFNPKTAPEERNAILISWDGALREHVRAALARGKLPNLEKLARQGALVDIDVTGHQTDTKAGHAQLLTGYDPSLTGVYSNGKFNPIPRGYSIFERLTQAFGKQGITTIMLTGKDHNLGSRPPGLLSHGEPYYLVRPGITVWDGDQMRPASTVGEKAVHYTRFQSMVLSKTVSSISPTSTSVVTALVKVRWHTTTLWSNAIVGWARS